MMTRPKKELIQHSSNATNEETMRIEDVCAFLNFSPSTIDKHVLMGNFPKPGKLFSRNVWFRSEVENWRNSQLKRGQ